MAKLVLIFFLLASLWAYADDNNRLLEYNLGEISFKKVAIQKYEFKEEIKSAISLCECVKVNVYKKEAPKAEPLYIVNIEFDPKDYEGQVTQDIMLLDKNDNLITLRIKAFVR